MTPAASVPTDGTTTPTTTPATPTEAAPRWQRIAKAALFAVCGWLIGQVYFRITGERIQVQVIPLPQTAESMIGEPYDYEGCSYHGDQHVEHLHDAEAARWPTDKITYGIDYASAARLNPPLSEEAIKAAFRQGAGWWTDGCDLELSEVSFAAAMVPIKFEPMDGPGGVLAEAYLADGTNRPKPMRFDSRERWTAGAPAANLVSLPTVFCHEFGHSLGLNHDAANAPAVMRPTYSASIPREQPRDIDRLVQLGYTRRPKVPTVPSDVLTVPASIRTADVVEALKRAGYGVTGP